MCGFYKIFLRTGKLRPLKVFYNQEITREDCVQFRTGGASREDCVRSQPVQSITGGLCAVSATAEHHGRTVCRLSHCRASPLQSITGGLCAVSASAEHHGRTVCGLSRCRSHGRTVCGLSRCRSHGRTVCRLSHCRASREDCVPSQILPPLVSRSGRTSGGLRSVVNPYLILRLLD